MKLHKNITAGRALDRKITFAQKTFIRKQMSWEEPAVILKDIWDIVSEIEEAKRINNSIMLFSEEAFTVHNSSKLSEAISNPSTEKNLPLGFKSGTHSFLLDLPTASKIISNLSETFV